MIIQRTNLNVFFPKVNNLRRKIFELEEKLADSFVIPFNLIPIPDEAPEEIPRIIMTSRGGHSTLNLSLNVAQFTTTYDDAFQHDWDKCSDYLRDKISTIYRVLDNLSNGNFLFSGLTTEIFIGDLEEDPIDLLQQFFNIESSQKPFDLHFKYTLVKEDRYYINVAVNNLRQYAGLTGPQIMSFSNLVEKKGLGIQLDINDRYGFNFQNNYISTSNQIQRILDYSDQIIPAKIDKMIFEGVFEI